MIFLYISHIFSIYLPLNRHSVWLSWLSCWHLEQDRRRLGFYVARQHFWVEVCLKMGETKYNLFILWLETILHQLVTNGSYGNYEPP
jgi:hypothetical protein